MEIVKPFSVRRIILFWRQLVAMASRLALSSVHRTYDVHHWFRVHDVNESQNLKVNSRTMAELSCSTGRDRLLNPGNISSNFKHIVAGSRHFGKVFAYMMFRREEIN